MVTVVNASGNQDIDGILWGWKYSSSQYHLLVPDQHVGYSRHAQVNGFARSAPSRRTRRARPSTTSPASPI